MDWQLIIALAVVALAAGYVLRRAVYRRAGKSAGACFGCHSCPASSSAERLPERPFIAADQLEVFSHDSHSPKRSSAQHLPSKSKD